MPDFLLVTDLEARMNEVDGLTEDEKEEIRELARHLQDDPFTLPPGYTYRGPRSSTDRRRATINRIGIWVAYTVDADNFTIEIPENGIRERKLRRIGLTPRLPRRKRSK